MLNRRGFAVMVFGMLAGCGQTAAPPTTRKASAGRAPHLTDADVQAFLDVVQELPDGKAPTFQPAAEFDLTTDTRAAEMVARWQREFRSSYSPEVQARLWKRDARLRGAIDDSGLDAEQFARLLVKLSTAVVREALDPRIDLTQMGKQADSAIASLSSQFDGLDSDPRLSPSVRNGRAEFLSTVLNETVAYREFLRLLEAVPPESIVIAAKHRAALRRLMPATETVQAFEKRIESQATVIRASHDEPGRRMETLR